MKIQYFSINTRFVNRKLLFLGGKYAKIYAIKNETGSIKDIVNNGKIIFKDKHGAQIYNNGT